MLRMIVLVTFFLLSGFPIPIAQSETPETTKSKINGEIEKFVSNLRCKDGTNPKIITIEDSKIGRPVVTVKCRSGQQGAIHWSSKKPPAIPSGFSLSTDPGTSSTGGRRK